MKNLVYRLSESTAFRFVLSMGIVIAFQLTRRLVGGSELWQQIGNWLIS